MRDPKLTFLIRCAYGAVWLALIWLMVRYVLVWLLPFLIALALAALLEPAVVLCRRRLHLRRGFTATVLSLVVLGTVAAGLVLLAMVLLRQVCELSGRLPGYLEALPRWTELVRGRAQQLCAACPEGLRSWLEALLDGLSAQLAKLLESMGLEVTLRNLEVGDYAISERVAVERKTARDFVSSIIDPQRNLFRQMADLARTYDRPIVILEGRDFYGTQMSPASIQGALASVAVDYGVPIIPTEDQDDTARIISLLVQREKKEGREPKAHGHKTARTLKEQQEYLISAIPSVGPRVARNLLRHFGSIQRVMTASEEELRDAPLVGPKIAERIRELVGGEYKG